MGSGVVVVNLYVYITFHCVIQKRNFINIVRKKHMNVRQHTRELICMSTKIFAVLTLTDVTSYCHQGLLAKKELPITKAHLFLTRRSTYPLGPIHSVSISDPNRIQIIL